MPILASEKKEFQRDLLEDDTYESVIVSIIDLGTQNKEWQGKITKKRIIKFVFELPEERLPEFKTEDGQLIPERPVKISKKFNLSISERSELGKMVGSLKLNSSFFDSNGKLIVDKLLGFPCRVLTGAADLPSGVKINVINGFLPSKKKLKNESNLILFSIGDFDDEIFKSLNEYDRADIEKSPEYKTIIAAAKKAAGLNEEDVIF